MIIVLDSQQDDAEAFVLTLYGKTEVLFIVIF